jgi:hypothetical protein
MKKYILAIVVNTLLAVASLVPVVLGFLLINGIFSTPPIEERIKGWLILAATSVVVLTIDTITYRKKYRGNIKWFIPISIGCWILMYGIALLILFFS